MRYVAKKLILSILLASMITLIIYNMYMIAISLAIILIAILLNDFLKKYEAKNSLEEELPFIVLLAASSPITGFEFFDVLEHIRNVTLNVFREFKKLSIKIFNLSNLVNINNTLNIIADQITSNKVKLFLRDHAASIINGTSIEHLDYSASEYIRDYHRRVINHLALRSNITMLSALLFTVIPLISIGLIPLIGIDLPLMVILILIIAMIIIMGVFPKYPLILSISRIIGYNRLRDIAPVVGLAIFPLSVYVVNISFEYMYMKLIGLVTSFILIILGLFNFRDTYLALLLINGLRRIYNIIGQYARTYRTLQMLDLNCYSINSIKAKIPWLLKYTCISIEYLKSKGEVNPVHIDRFIDYIVDLLSIYKSYILVIFLIFAVSIMQPLIFYNLIKISYIEIASPIVYSLAMIPYFFSILASRLAFDDIGQTLIPGIVVVLISILFW